MSEHKFIRCESEDLMGYKSYKCRLCGIYKDIGSNEEYYWKGNSDINSQIKCDDMTCGEFLSKDIL